MKNRILLSLPEREFQSIFGHLSLVELRQGQVLHNADNRFDHACFLNGGMTSSISVTAEGDTVDIFTHEVAERLRKIIRSEFHGPEGRIARQTIRQDDPSKVIVRLHVNDVFPEGIPLTTTPPNLLLRLPELPQELAYRFVGRDLTRIDTKAGLIVDLIPNAIP